MTVVEAIQRSGIGEDSPPEAIVTWVLDRFAGRAQEFASLTTWLDEACTGQPRVVSVFGEAGTGTAMVLRQLESEIRLRGGLFVMAASPNIGVWPPYGVWCALLTAANRFPSAPRRECYRRIFRATGREPDAADCYATRGAGQAVPSRAARGHRNNSTCRFRASHGSHGRAISVCKVLRGKRSKANRCRRSTTRNTERPGSSRGYRPMA